MKFKSLKKQLVVTTLALVTIPMILSTAVSYVNTSHTAIADALNANEWQAWTVETQAEMMIERNLSALHSIAKSPAVVNFVTGRTANSTEMTQHLRDLDAYFDDGNQSVISNAKGEQLARSEGKLVSVKDRPYFIEAMKGHEYISDQLHNQTTNESFIALSVPIKDGDKVVGVLQRNYNTHALHEMLAQYTDEGFIVDRDGIVIAHSDYELKPGENGEDLSTSPMMQNSEGSYETKYDGTSKYISYALYEKAGFRVCLVQDKSKVLAKVTDATVASLIISLLATIIACIVTLIFSTRLIRPIVMIKESLDKVANGDLSETVNVDREDELGQIAQATNHTCEALQQIVDKVQSAADMVSEQAQSVSTSLAQINDTSSAVTSAMGEMATAATDQAHNIEDASTSTGEFAEAIQQVTDRTNDLAQMSKETSSIADSTEQTLTSLVARMQEMSAVVDGITGNMTATSDAVANMDTLVGSIAKIAEQVKLLALNASIEAARAGEAGRGFNVVAEEISKLAQDTADTTKQIKEGMDTLVHSSEEATTSAKAISATNDEVLSTLHETVDSMHELLDHVQDTVQDIDAISNLTATCVTSKETIVDAMSNLSAISEENAASTEETAASMDVLSTTVSTLAQSSSELASIAEVLEDELKFFKDNEGGNNHE